MSRLEEKKTSMANSVTKSVEVLNLEKVVKDLEKRIALVQTSLDE